MKTIKTILPVFPGFYGTYFEYDEESRDIDYFNDHHGTDYSYDDFDWDYKEYHNRIARHCVEVVEEKLQEELNGIKIKFLDIYSPRFYNYTNDKIEVELEYSKEDLEKVLDIIIDEIEEFDSYLHENYTSRDGFSSFYSNKVRVWLNEYLRVDHKDFTHCFQSVLNYLLLQAENDASWLYDKAIEKAGRGIRFTLKPRYYNATIQWKDTQDIEDVIIKIGPIEEDDDQIFFYMENEKELEEYNHEWKILEYTKRNQ